MQCIVHAGGFLDSLVTKFANTSSVWQNEINPIAKRLFSLLFALEFMWQLVVKKIFAGDVEKIWVFFFTRTILGFLFAHYITNPELYQQVIEYVANLGSKVSGYTLSLTPGNNYYNSLSPSEVIGNFACIADSIHQISDKTGSFNYLTVKFALAIMQVLLFVVLAFLSFYLMKVILQAYFLLYAGFLLTGFAGSSWTVTFWQQYVKAISGTCIKFLAVCFILGILEGEVRGWAAQINAAYIANDIIILSGVVLNILGSSIVMLLLSYQLPEWAALTLTNNVKVRFFNDAG
ncbi:MAG: type secretion system protein TrbL [Pseudomonadota bacterium]|nr:type secretion system protein TrbL [Pseudomonadota bacterium]